jgi:signal transduction histidine kinase
VPAAPEPSAPADHDHRAELASLLRGVATRLATMTDGAVLVFLEDETQGSFPLRSAAGLPTPELAVQLATRWAAPLEQVGNTGEALAVEPSLLLGPRDAAGANLVPIPGTRGVLGILATTFATTPTPGLAALVTLTAESLGAQIENCALRAELTNTERDEDEKSDEILRLSEELFSQDVELLRNNEQLGQVERLKNDFIEKMSRELRTPLNGIIEAIIAVLAGENDVLSQNAKSGLRNALDDGTAFLRTLQNILDLWRIKQEELPVTPQEVNFREVVEEAIFSVQDTLGNKPISIEKHFEEPLPKIRTDLTKANQILFLLLDNAAKFTERGTIDIFVRMDQAELVFEVRDTGIGICPDDQRFAFDEFYQVDDLASTKYRGSGLGLSLVRDLVALLEGSISMRSDVGEGSSFSVRLPVEVLG